MTDDLVTRLLAEIDEREQIAREATPGPWHANDGLRCVNVEQSEEDGGHLVAELEPCDDHPDIYQPDGDHIAENDPAAVLRMCQAHRDIVAACNAEAYELGSRLATEVLAQLAEGYGLTGEKGP